MSGERGEKKRCSRANSTRKKNQEEEGKGGEGGALCSSYRKFSRNELSDCRTAFQAAKGKGKRELRSHEP